MKNLPRHITVILLSTLLLTSCSDSGDTATATPEPAQTLIVGGKSTIGFATGEDVVDTLTFDNVKTIFQIVPEVEGQDSLENVIPVTIDITGKTCGVPGFIRNFTSYRSVYASNTVDVNGVTLTDDDYIKISVHYALGDSPTDFISGGQIRAAGIYSQASNIPDNDSNLLHAVFEQPENYGGLYLDDDDNNFTVLYKVPQSVMDAAQDGTLFIFSLDGESILDSRTGIFCEFEYGKGIHRVTLVTSYAADAQLDFTNATSSITLTDLGSDGNKVLISLDVAGDTCGVRGFGARPDDEVDANGAPFVSFEYINIDVTYGGDTLEDEIKLTGIYLPGADVPNDDTNVLSDLGEYNGDGKFSMIYEVPSDARVAGTEITFELPINNVNASITDTSCSFDGGPTHTLTINS